MDPKLVEATYRKYITALNERRFDEATQFYCERVKYNEQQFEREQFRDAVLMLGHQIAPDTQISIQAIVVDGDNLAARIIRKGTSVREFMGIPPSGKPTSLHEHAFYHFENGACDQVWSVVDFMPLFQVAAS